MSRIGRLPVPVPSGVEVSIDGQQVTVKGPKGTLNHTVAEPIVVAKGDDGDARGQAPERRARVALAARPDPLADRQHGHRRDRGLREEARDRRHRLPRDGQGLEPRVRPRLQPPGARPRPEGITFAVEGTTRLSVQGIDKQQVGEVAANIRKLRKPDPYKGKGVRYAGEQIRRKVGKAGK